MTQERFGDALSALDAVAGVTPADNQALLLRAALLTNAGRLADAEAACGLLLTRDELNAGANYVMALCCEHRGDHAAAARHDETAVYLDSSFAMPRLHMGLAARRTGDHAAARAHLSQAMILLEREETARLAMFGGGFSREMLLSLCRSELTAAGVGR
jgi:chemotaxis protein methyltransferase CheR